MKFCSRCGHRLTTMTAFTDVWYDGEARPENEMLDIEVPITGIYCMSCSAFESITSDALMIDELDKEAEVFKSSGVKIDGGVVDDYHE